MNTLTSDHLAAAAAGKSALARLLRQASVLREQNDTAGAARLEANEIPATVRSIRLAHGPDALPDAELQAMMVAEDQRVVEAVILAKLLISQLVVTSPVISERGRSNSARSMPEPVAPKTMAGPPAISDMLDAMLAAERTGRRPAPAIHRES